MDLFLSSGRHKGLLLVQSASKRNPHYQTLERDLIELQEQQLFELFVVVSLQKKSSEIKYTPQIIQQFPSKVRPAWKHPHKMQQLFISYNSRCAVRSNPVITMNIILTSLREVKLSSSIRDLCANNITVFDTYMFWIHKINKGL